MATLSLREAAEQVGVSKSTIFRAIRSGRMSAGKDDDGNFLIDPAELFRVYEPKPAKDDVADNVPTQAETRARGQDAQTSETFELRLRQAELEAQINALKQILETEKERTQELKAERDKWAEQAQRLALAGPQEKRGFFGWLKRA